LHAHRRHRLYFCGRALHSDGCSGPLAGALSRAGRSQRCAGGGRAATELSPPITGFTPQHVRGSRAG
ncbi:MAG: hypothetical protein ACRDL7_01010, partial [Gaiellaceae bacterium]